MEYLYAPAIPLVATPFTIFLHTFLRAEEGEGSKNRTFWRAPLTKTKAIQFILQD